MAEASRRRPEILIVGRLGRAHGVLGEVALFVLTDFPERFQPGAQFLMGPGPGDRYGEPGMPPPDEMAVVTLATVRPAKDRLLVRFAGSDDRSAAEAQTGAFLYVPIEDALPLDEDEYYPHELIGLTARTEEGAEIGHVADLIDSGEVTVLVIRQADRPDVMVPMVAQFIVRVDLSAGEVVIRPIAGLLD